jgi:excisionase family DNA binding protein
VEKQDTPFLTVTQLAEAAGVTVGNIRQLLLRGSLNGRKLGSTIWVIPREEAEHYLERRKGRRRAKFRSRRTRS